MHGPKARSNAITGLKEVQQMLREHQCECSKRLKIKIVCDIFANRHSTRAHLHPHVYATSDLASSALIILHHFKKTSSLNPITGEPWIPPKIQERHSAPSLHSCFRAPASQAVDTTSRASPELHHSVHLL